MLNLDLRNTQADTGADPIPAGWYMAMIDESSLVDTKGGTGNKMLKLRFNIIEGQFANRKVFTNFNIIHSNVMTQEIAQKQLKAVCVAVGHHGLITDSAELHAKPCRIKVKIRKATEEYEASNDIVSYLSKDAPLPASAGATAPAIGAPQATPPAAFAAQPWAAAAPAAAMPPATTGAPVFPAVQQPAAAPAASNVPWASAPAAAPSPVAAPAPAAPVAPPAQPIKVMTAKAAGATYEQFVAGNWTDEAMIREGYMVLETPAPAAPPAAPVAPAAPAAPAAPVAPPTTPAPVAPAAGAPLTPPWATQ
jgi:hypothetical protein